MPPSQLTVPPSIHQLLDSVRSKIFMTTYNPTAQRSGVKYIKRKLQGPRVLQYYPEIPTKPSALNNAGVGGLYPGWTGIIPGVASTSTVPAASIPTNLPPTPDSAFQSTSMTGSPGIESPDSSTAPTVSASASTQLTDTSTPSSSAPSPSSDLATALRTAGIKPQSMYFGLDNWIGSAPPVAQWPTKWQVDEREEARVDKLARRRRIGKVAPKKGERLFDRS